MCIPNNGARHTIYPNAGCFPKVNGGTLPSRALAESQSKDNASREESARGTDLDKTYSSFVLPLSALSASIERIEVARESCEYTVVLPLHPLGSIPIAVDTYLAYLLRARAHASAPLSIYYSFGIRARKTWKYN